MIKYDASLKIERNFIAKNIISARAGISLPFWGERLIQFDY